MIVGVQKAGHDHHRACITSRATLNDFAPDVGMLKKSESVNSMLAELGDGRVRVCLMSTFARGLKCDGDRSRDA